MQCSKGHQYNRLKNGVRVECSMCICQVLQSMLTASTKADVVCLSISSSSNHSEPVVTASFQVHLSGYFKQAPLACHHSKQKLRECDVQQQSPVRQALLKVQSQCRFVNPAKSCKLNTAIDYQKLSCNSHSAVADHYLQGLQRA